MTTSDAADPVGEPANSGIVVDCFGALAGGGHRGSHAVRAATLGSAASAIGLALDQHVVAVLVGDQITRHAKLPLVAGDTLAFLRRTQAADRGRQPGLWQAGGYRGRALV